MIFIYTAINSDGVKVNGEIEAIGKSAAESRLTDQGYIPLEVNPCSLKSKVSKLDKIFNKPSSEDIILFTKQFQVMVDAGVSIIKVFSILHDQTENVVLKQVVAEIGTDIEEGSDLFDAFSKHNYIFSNLYCSLLKAGEKSGSLGEVLNRLAYVIDHENKVKQSVKAALRYPLMVIGFLGISFVILLTFVIPRFSKIFTKAKLELPLPTKICIVLSDILTKYWIPLVIVLVILVFAYKALMKTNRGKLMRDSFLLEAPLFGVLIKKTIMSRFTSIFAILQHSGVSVLASLEILEGCLNNQAITKEFATLRERLEGGEGIATPLRDSKYFPPLVVNMISIGEESGKLDVMLSEVAKHYDIEVEFAVKRITEILPTILTIGLAVVVGFFALAIYMPMWDLTKLAKH